MSRLCAEDVERLRRAIVAIEAHNVANPDEAVALMMDGPRPKGVPWEVSVYLIRRGYLALGKTGGETLGDALNGAMEAWKETRVGSI